MVLTNFVLPWSRLFKNAMKRHTKQHSRCILWVIYTQKKNQYICWFVLRPFRDIQTLFLLYLYRNSSVPLGFRLNTLSSSAFDPLVLQKVPKFNRLHYTFHSFLDFALTFWATAWDMEVFISSLIYIYLLLCRSY